MRSFRRTIGALLLAGLAAGFFSGCGNAPTAPESVSTTDSATLTRTVESDGLLSGIGGLVDALAGLIVRTLRLVGSIGGSLTNGRWSVVVPAGAVNGSAIIAIGVANPASPECQLEITPADQNHFEVPVTVTIDCRSVSSSQLRNYVVRWYDPSTRRWVTVEGSRVDMTAKTVSAPLLHFSRYSVGPDEGKAGW